MHTNLGYGIQFLKHVMPGNPTLNPKRIHKWMDGLAPRFFFSKDGLTCRIHVDNQHMYCSFVWAAPMSMGVLKYQIPNLQEGIIAYEHTSHSCNIQALK
jgi:hypothetical protein